MAKIGVIQVDGKIPNLALMKIAGYHEQKNDFVEWFQGIMFWEQYEKVYASKLFNFSQMPQLPPNAIVGGTGIDFFNRLPKEIEEATPSYSLYPECNYHLGFSMKGCRFSCDFCCVPKKEGKPYNYNAIDEILINPNGENRLMLLDNDFFGGSKWEANLERIRELDLKVCFVQGLNIRIITDRQAATLSKVKYYNSKFKQRYLTFAWDIFQDKEKIIRGIDRCAKNGIPPEHMQFFVLIGFDTTPEQDYYRVNFLKEMGCKPFVMPYKKDDTYQKAFARWVNYRPVFETVSWEEYRYNPSKFDKSKKDLTEVE